MTLLLITFVILLIVFYDHYKHQFWRRRGVKQFDTDFIFGNFKEVALFWTAPGKHMANLHHRAANLPYVGFYIFHKPCLLLRDPKIIKKILVTDFNNFTDRHFAGSAQKDSMGMINLFGAKNAVWKYLRSKITPTLSGKKLKAIFPLLTETGQQIVDYLKTVRSNENHVKIVDVQELLYKHAADLTANIGFGTKINSFKQPETEFTKGAMEFFRSFKREVALVTVFFIPDLVKIFGSVILFPSKFVKRIFWNRLNSRGSGNSRGDFIDSLMELKNAKQNPIYKFEFDNLLHQCGMFLSGFESSSKAACFTLTELAGQRQCQEKARKDIVESIEKYGWSIKAFDEMKYLDKCVTEGLRLHPSVPTIDRYALNDYQIDDNIVIEKGTPVFISLHGLQQDVEYFQLPDIFDPERDDPDKFFTKISFGLGRRMCVGMKLGLYHVKMILAMILTEYDVYQTTDVSYESKSTIGPANIMNLEFKPLTEKQPVEVSNQMILEAITSLSSRMDRFEAKLSKMVDESQKILMKLEDSVDKRMNNVETEVPEEISASNVDGVEASHSQ